MGGASSIFNTDSARDRTIKMEREMLSSMEMCLSGIEGEIKAIKERRNGGDTLLYSLNARQIAKDLAFRFHDSGVMESITCLLSSTMIIDAESFQQGLVSQNYFTPIKSISSGAKGIITIAQHAGTQFYAVIKHPRSDDEDVFEGEEYVEIVHELFMGLKIVNQFRRFCLNFVYTYASYVKDGVPHILLEYIPGLTFGEFFLQSTVTQGDYLSVLVQVLIALDVAESLADFEHSDLHDENIMIRKVTNEDEEFVWVPFNSRGTVDYVKAKYIPVIIDLSGTSGKYGNDRFDLGVRSDNYKKYTQFAEVLEHYQEKFSWTKLPARGATNFSDEFLKLNSEYMMDFMWDGTKGLPPKYRILTCGDACVDICDYTRLITKQGDLVDSDLRSNSKDVVYYNSVSRVDPKIIDRVKPLIDSNAMERRMLFTRERLQMDAFKMPSEEMTRDRSFIFNYTRNLYKQLKDVRDLMVYENSYKILTEQNSSLHDDLISLRAFVVAQVPIILKVLRQLNGNMGQYNSEFGGLLHNIRVDTDNMATLI